MVLLLAVGLVEEAILALLGRMRAVMAIAVVRRGLLFRAGNARNFRTGHGAGVGWALNAAHRVLRCAGRFRFGHLHLADRWTIVAMFGA